MKLLFIENWIGDETLKTIGWTLFHSLWIGLLAAVASGVIIIITRKSTARLRYNLLTGVMFLFLLACTICFFIQNQSSKTSLVQILAANTDTVNPDVSSGEHVFITSKNFVDEFKQYFNTNADLFVLIWLIFFVIHSIKLLTGVAGVHRLRNYKTVLASDEWIVILTELSNKLGIRQSVTLLQSELIKVPVAVSFLKPVILVPMGLLSNLPPDQVEAILLHELAHIRRKDYLINLLQRFAEAIFFFNPSFIWLCSLIRQEREACCDDIVVTTTGQNRNYLEALVSFQEYSVSSSEYAMAIRSKQHYLLNRVKRLLTRENKKLNVMEKLLLLFGLIVFTAFTIIPQKEERKKILTKDSVMINKAAEPKVQTRKIETLHVKKPRDTVPPKEKHSESDFKQISSNVNIDGNTKTETITAFDLTGKKYTIVRLNDRLTSLQVDDKTIPENEIGNYASVINQIEQAREKIRQRKMKEKEARKAEYEKKKIVHENKVKEKNKILDDKMKTKIAAFDSQLEEAIKKKIDTKRKELDADRKVLDKKREEMADVKKEIIIKKQELKKKDGKEKEDKLKEIRSKSKEVNRKLKEIENKKKIMDNKKQEIGEEKEKLEKIKEKEKEGKEKEKESKKNDKKIGEKKGPSNLNRIDGKKILNEKTISITHKAFAEVNADIFKNISYDHKVEVYKDISYETGLKDEVNSPEFRHDPASPVSPAAPPQPKLKKPDYTNVLDEGMQKRLVK